MQLSARRANDALIGLFSLVRIPIFSRYLDVKSGSGTPVIYQINHVAFASQRTTLGARPRTPSVGNCGCNLCPSSASNNGCRSIQPAGLADVRRTPTFFRSLHYFPKRLQRNTDHFRFTPYQQAVSPYQGEVRCRSLFSRAARPTRDVRKPCKPGRAGSACRLEAEVVRRCFGNVRCSVAR